MTLDNFRIMK